MSSSLTRFLESLERRKRPQADEREGRMLTRPVELRTGTGEPVLEGYAAVFDQDTQIGPDSCGWMERVAPGAFTRSIAENDVLSFFNHDDNQVLGRTSAQTLALIEDATGLRAVIRPPDTSAGRDVVTLIQRGDVKGMSFMFRVRKELWEEPTTKGQLPRRTILDVDLIEAGPVTMPAYEQTSIGARDKARELLTRRAPARAAGSEGDAEEAAELVGYESLRALFGQARMALDAGEQLIDALIADETETPTETDDEEAAEEIIETARLTSIVAFAEQAAGSLASAIDLATSLNEEAGDATGLGMNNQRQSAETTAADADRVRWLRLARVGR